MRILYLHPTLQVGGAETLRLTLVKHMDRECYDIQFCCIQDKGAIGEELEAMGYPMHVLGRPVRTTSIGTTIAIYRLLRTLSVDVLQSSLFHANWHGRIAARLAGVPIVIAEEHCLHDEQGDSVRYNPRAGWFFRLADRGLARVTDRIITCSEAVANSIAHDERIPAEKFLSLPNVVDTGQFRPSGQRDAVRQELGYHSEDIVAGSVGSLKVGKGLRELLEAFVRARAAVPALRLLVIGDGPLRAQVEAICAKHGLGHDVKLIGARRDIARWLSAMDLFISASLSEGFGLSTLEAMAMGLPCVATRVGGVPEVVIDGETGIVVPPGDVAALADAMIKIAGDPGLGKRLGAVAAARAQRSFMPQGYIQRLTALYEELARRKGVRGSGAPPRMNSGR